MKKTSKTGIILIASALVCVLLALAVGIPNGFFGDGGKGGDLDDENTPGMEEIMDGGSPLLVFDKSDAAIALMNAFDKDQIASVRMLYGDNESLVELESNERSVITDAYKGLKNIVVGDSSDSAKAAANSYVTFVLDDGTEITYNFAGDSVLCYDGSDSAEKGNYEVDGTGQLWDVYKSMEVNNVQPQ